MRFMHFCNIVAGTRFSVAAVIDDNGNITT
jgi:hypothetical protein